MGNKAIFLDRDDTLIEDPGYINHPNQVKLLPGVAEALIDLKRMGYLLVIVTNQSGVARGIVTEEGLEEIHQQLRKLLQFEGAAVDAVYYCPYHPNGSVAEYRMESDLRKPEPGMLLKAAEDMDIDLEQSWMLGNAYRDIAAGIRAGCKTILITSAAKPAQKNPSDPIPFKKAVNMREAANIVKMHEQSQAARTGGRVMPEPPDAGAASRPRPGRKERKSRTRAAAPPPPAAVPENQPAAPVETPARTAAVTETPTASAPVESGENMYGEREHMPADRTAYLLEEILRYLKSVHRENLFHEFSLMKVLAGTIQILVFFCLLLSVWYLLDHAAERTSVLIALGYAVVLQLMVIAFYMMRDRR